MNYLVEKVYWLRQEQNMSFSEISQCIGRNIGYVKSAYAKALKHYKKDKTVEESNAEELRVKFIRDALGLFATVPVSDLDLSPRVRNALILEEVLDLGSLMALESYKDLRNVGDKGWMEIEAVQKKYRTPEFLSRVNEKYIAELNEIKKLLTEAEFRLAELNLSFDTVSSAIDEINTAKKDILDN